MKKSVYDQVYEIQSPHVENYRSDLEKIDKEFIEAPENNGIPFIHYSRKNGTHLYFLLPIERLPKKGEIVPYLFEQADRDHIMREVLTMAQYHASPAHREDIKQVIFFDGLHDGAGDARKITVDYAVKIAQAYISKMKYAFKHE